MLLCRIGKRKLIGTAAFLAFLALCVLAAAQSKPAQRRPKSETLPTGMSITPTAAKGSSFQPLNPDLPDLPQFTADHPISTAVSPDGKTLLILTSGFNRTSDIKGKAVRGQSNEYVFVFDIHAGTAVKLQALKIPNSYVGLAWSPDGAKFFAAGGSNDNVHVFERAGAAWAESGEPIVLGHKTGLGVSGFEESGKVAPIHPVAAGLAVSPDGKRLLVANYANDSVSLVDIASRTVTAELDLRPGKNDPAQKGVAGGEYPYGVAFHGEDKAYVSSLRDREIVAIDLKPAPKVAARIKVHGQPGKIILNKAGSLLFSAADNSDSVVIINTATNRVAAEIKTTAPPGIFANRGGFKGSNPNSLALSPDEKTLYVTNGGTNSVAVIRLDRDHDDSQVVGLIPTGWYPTSVSVSADGATLYVVNGKSVAGPNPGGCRNYVSTESDADHPCSLAQQYVLQLENGGFSVIPRPAPAELQSLTRQVAANNHFTQTVRSRNAGEKDQRVFAFLRSRVKHVIYIVKENRTYDQVLGDLEKGNGDRSLTLFPQAISPNHHELARSFVTLDNFYASGSVSGDGWNWSTAARATDLVQRIIPMDYAKRGMTYDVEGENRGVNISASSAVERRTAGLDDPEDLLPGSADVAAPDGPEDDEAGAGYLWDSVLRAKLSLRNYGFFVDLRRYYPEKGKEPEAPLLHDPAATSTRIAMANNVRLQPITDPYFRGFDQKFADYWRFKEWEREFDDFVKHDNLPSLELVRLAHDHLGSFKEAMDGVNTVETQMADNDYALGLLVEKVAHSRYAKDTLIFVVEDDAQNGPDHVDAHRTIAYVIGPYVKQRAVASQNFNTVSMLRTIEDVLGIQHLGLNDAVQSPMTEVFSTSQSKWTYTAKVPAVLRSTQLPLPSSGAAAVVLPVHDAEYWAQQTVGFDFSGEDKLDAEQFNRVLWAGLMDGKPYPEERDGRDLRKRRGRPQSDMSAAH